MYVFVGKILCLHYIVQSTGATAVPHSYFGKVDGIFYMRSVNCIGSETRLIDCAHFVDNPTVCTDGQFAGITCIGECSA